MAQRADLNLRPYEDFDYPRLLDAPVGGVWPARPDCFRVEELPLYPFAGEGEHAALVVEKENLATRDLALRAAEILGVGPAAVGYAGMKDKAAVVVQSFTVTGCDEGKAAEAFTRAGARVLTATRHRNKLRLGHLAGNRFAIRLEGSDAAAASAALAELSRCGVPNWFGPQRFGLDGRNAREGFEILARRRKTGRWRRDLLVSALQSFLFNELLARRIEEGALGRVASGDLLQKSDTGGIFLCEDPDADQKRCDAFEVSPTGPLPGKKMVHPSGAAAEAEEAVLAELGLSDGLFAGETGARRSYRVRLEGAGVAEESGGLRIVFALPPGSYATSVVREIAASGVRRIA